MERIYIGIDVSKKSFDLYRLPDEHHQIFDNDKEGIKACLKTMKTRLQPLVALESTGGYERELALALHQAGIPTAVVNPRRIRDFAKACGQLAKTDKIDARMIATYAATLKPPARGVLDVHRQELKALVARRGQLVKMHTAELNRMEHSFDETVADSINAILCAIEAQQETVEKQIEKHIDNTPEFKRCKSILLSVPGIGETTACMLVSEVPELGRLNRREIASLIGVAPVNRDSGSFRGKRMTGGGRRHVRTSLFMPTLVAIQHNPSIRFFYQRLLDNGKEKMTAVIACMRKFLTILNTMVAHQEYWRQKYT